MNASKDEDVLLQTVLCISIQLTQKTDYPPFHPGSQQWTQHVTLYTSNLNRTKLGFALMTGAQGHKPKISKTLRFCVLQASSMLLSVLGCVEAECWVVAEREVCSARSMASLLPRSAKALQHSLLQIQGPFQSEALRTWALLRVHPTEDKVSPFLQCPTVSWEPGSARTT